MGAPNLHLKSTASGCSMNSRLMFDAAVEACPLLAGAARGEGVLMDGDEMPEVTSARFSRSTADGTGLAATGGERPAVERVRGRSAAASLSASVSQARSRSCNWPSPSASLEDSPSSFASSNTINSG